MYSNRILIFDIFFMWLDDFIPSEWMDSWPKSAEISEKFKEAVKKSAAGIKRVQKDEKKAKKYDLLLAHFLVEIIKNPKYDFLLPSLFSSLDHGFPSNFLLWILSLIHIDISDKIRDISQKQKIVFSYQAWEYFIDFDGNNLDISLQKRINDWMEDIIDVLWIDSSQLQIQRLQSVTQTEKEYLYNFTTQIFYFFFQELKINISQHQAQSYCEFILWEVFKKIKNIPLQEV